MTPNALNQFTEALKKCTSCGSRCTATLPATDLTRLVKEVVSELTPSGWGDAPLSQDYHPRTFLLILTYSYACGVFGSENIAAELEDRAERCALVDLLAIDAPTLARFRRENHGLLRSCLTAVLTRLDAPGRRGPGPERNGARETPEHAVRLSLPMDPSGEAQRRIIQAAQTDSEEGDLY